MQPDPIEYRYTPEGEIKLPRTASTQGGYYYRPELQERLKREAEEERRNAELTDEDFTNRYTEETRQK